jgi:hypothetical protein
VPRAGFWYAAESRYVTDVKRGPLVSDLYIHAYLRLMVDESGEIGRGVHVATQQTLDNVVGDEHAHRLRNHLAGVLAGKMHDEDGAGIESSVMRGARFFLFQWLPHPWSP